MRTTNFAISVTPKHPRNFNNAGVIRYDVCIGSRHGSDRTFAHHDVMMCSRRYLREMRNGEYLMMSRDTPHQRAYLPRHCATNTGIDFVENKRRHLL